MKRDASEEFDPLFYPDSIAVIGASEDPNRLGFHCLLSLVKGGFGGRIYPINPHLSQVHGLKAYPSLKLVPDKIDLVIITVRASSAPSLLNECAEKGVRAVVLITAGFKEIEDETGAELQYEVAAIANKAGIKIIGPNTFGMVNLPANLNASFTPEFSLLRIGDISLISQSGGLCHLIGPLSLTENVGFSKLMSLGNRCNVDFADMLEYLVDDTDTKVIMIYIEGVDDARRLLEVLRRVAKRKPIVALKAGRSQIGNKAAYSHTGSLAGRYEIYSAAFKQAGVIAVDSSMELLAVAKALSLCPLPAGNRVAVLSGQAGPGMIASDLCLERGLILANFSAETRKKIEQLLPPLSMRTNPIDMGPAWYDSQRCRRIVEVALADENVDGLILYAAYASANEDWPRELAKWWPQRAYRKPVVACFPAPAGIWVEEKIELEQNGLPIYSTPEIAVEAFVGLVERLRYLTVNGDDNKL